MLQQILENRHHLSAESYYKSQYLTVEQSEKSKVYCTDQENIVHLTRTVALVLCTTRKLQWPFVDKH